MAVAYGAARRQQCASYLYDDVGAAEDDIGLRSEVLEVAGQPIEVCLAGRWVAASYSAPGTAMRPIQKIMQLSGRL